MRRVAVLFMIVLALTGCVGVPAAPLRREALTRQIAEDAAAFNEAYGQAVSAQILLNVLRARDRLPRHYLSMTGISDSPSLRWSQSGAITGVPLGDGASPWGFGNFGLERETQSRPSYAVQPFSAETLTRAAFQPTEPYVFAHYWRSGWPRDLLALVMVERIEKLERGGRAQSYVNEANEIFDNCAVSVATGGCAFVRELRGFLSNYDAPLSGRGIELAHGAPAEGLPVCGLIEALAPTQPVRSAPPTEGEVCPPVFVVGSTRFIMHLRSLDDMVYYVGELLRIGSMHGHGGAIEAPVKVRAAGLRGGGAGVPLFRVIQGEAPRGLYAAAVRHGGAVYSAGPAIGRSCGEAAAEGPCMDDAAHGDRSSTVLSLFAEVLALNQSPDAIRAPSRLIAE